MAAAHKTRRVSVKTSGNKEEERDGLTMFDVCQKVALQRLVVVARLHGAADRSEVGAYYEKLNFQLNRQFIWDHVTGLMLIYPTCVLHVIESSRDVVVSLLKDFKEMKRGDGVAFEAVKVLFVALDPQSRLFQQWSYKVVGSDPTKTKAAEDEDENTETLVCSVLSFLHKLSSTMEQNPKTVPGSVLDENLHLLVSSETLEKLFHRDELQSPELHLQTYDAVFNVGLESGQVIRSSCLTTV